MVESLAVARFNAVNRGVYIADNLDFLRAINTASVDLVNIDPPFAKNDTFTADSLKPPLTSAEAKIEKDLLNRWGIFSPEQADGAGVAWSDDSKAKGGYIDQWAWDKDVHEDWLQDVAQYYPAAEKVIDAAKEVQGEGFAAYLSFMAVRLLEIRRILKPTGSLFLHCDYSADGYLRMALDAIFGKDNFRNEIVWNKGFRGTPLQGDFQHEHETIWSYANGSNPIWNTMLGEYKDKGLKRYNKVDEDGNRYALIRRKRSDGTVYYGKTYPQGKLMGNVFDIPIMASTSGERTGYPTQKPVALAERIISAVTNPGDVVLDVFAGCAYTCVAAERLGRRWTACDINPRAWTVFKRQFNKPSLALLTCSEETVGQQVLESEPLVTIHGYQELPVLETPLDYGVKPLRTENKARNYKERFTLMNRREMLEALLEFSSGRAWCCGFESRNANGTLAYGDYELDHIIPRSHGGEDDIVNRAPLCQTHNLLKSNLDMPLHDLRVEVAMRGEMKVTGQAELVSLDLARLYAVEVRKEAYQRKHGSG